MHVDFKISIWEQESQGTQMEMTWQNGNDR